MKKSLNSLNSSRCVTFTGSQVNLLLLFTDCFFPHCCCSFSPLCKEMCGFCLSLSFLFFSFLLSSLYSALVTSYPTRCVFYSPLIHLLMHSTTRIIHTTKYHHDVSSTHTLSSTSSVTFIELASLFLSFVPS